jgi:hypothetical protein
VSSFRRWLASIRPRQRPTLWIKHLQFPHRPWNYLPSGRRSRARTFVDAVPGENFGRGYHDRYLLEHNHLRYLLQLQYTDRLLGQLLARLRQEKLFDNTLLVVVSDHGYAFDSAHPRTISKETIGEIGPVTFFVKAPFQQVARIDDRFHSNVDVVPTVADVLKTPLSYHADGRSAFGPAPQPSEVRIPPNGFRKQAVIARDAYLAEREARMQRRLRLFGAGHKGLYRFWHTRRLVGTWLRRGQFARANRTRARFSKPRRFHTVRRGTGVVPAEITGQILNGRGKEREVALSVNGRIQAVGKTFHLVGDRREHFAEMVPEQSLHEGTNTVRLFQVVRGHKLRPLGAAR